MADTGIFATTAEVQYKAGANASATANVELYINSFMTQAESEINVATRKNWSDSYSSLNTDVKGILKEAASNLAAIYVIQFDMSGFTSRGEAESMITILRDGKIVSEQDAKGATHAGLVEAMFEGKVTVHEYKSIAAKGGLPFLEVKNTVYLSRYACHSDIYL